MLTYYIRMDSEVVGNTPAQKQEHKQKRKYAGREYSNCIKSPCIKNFSECIGEKQTAKQTNPNNPNNTDEDFPCSNARDACLADDESNGTKELRRKKCKQAQDTARGKTAGGGRSRRTKRTRTRRTKRTRARRTKRTRTRTRRTKRTPRRKR